MMDQGNLIVLIPRVSNVAGDGEEHSMTWNVYVCNNGISSIHVKEIPKQSECHCKASVLVGSNGGYDLHPPEHTIFGKVLRLDYFQSFDDGILDFVRIGHGFLGTVSF